MGETLLDVTQAPLFTFTSNGETTIAQVNKHLQEYRSILDRGRPYVVLFDVRTAGMIDAKSRKLYADFLNQNAVDLRLLCKGGAFVLTSSLMQGAMTAILWLAPLPFPHKTFTEMAEARAWLQSRI